MDKDLKGEILKCIEETVGLDEVMVILFGSHSSGEATELSDIDIGIHSFAPISDEDFLKLQEALNLNVNTLKRIDLLELSSASLDFLEFALKGATVWHVGREYLKNWLKPREL